MGGSKVVVANVYVIQSNFSLSRYTYKMFSILADTSKSKKQVVAIVRLLLIYFEEKTA